MVVPGQRPDTAYDYLKGHDIKNAIVSLDYNPLADRFKLKRVPVIYVMQGAQVKTVILNFEPQALKDAMRSLGLIS